MNKVILIGHIGKDAETTAINGGSTITKFSLATTETWKNKAGEKQQKTEWHNIELWNKQALETYLVKGAKIMCEGKIVYSESEKDGVKKYFTAIRVENIEFLSAKNDTAQQATPQRTAGTVQTTKFHECPDPGAAFDGIADEEDGNLPF